MLQLRVFGERPAMETLARRLWALEGADHITVAGDGNGDGHPRIVLTADIDAAIADVVLSAASAAGAAPADIAILRLDAIQPDHADRTDVVWADLLGLAAQYAHRGPRFLVFMAAAGVIAGYGVVLANGILIVGAMALSPDLLPIAATCIGLVLRRPRLVRRAALTLVAGLGVACL